MNTISISYRSRDNVGQILQFDLLKVKVKNRFFSIIEKASPLTKRRRLR